MLSVHALQAYILSACPRVQERDSHTSPAPNTTFSTLVKLGHGVTPGVSEVGLTLSAMLQTWWPQAVLKGVCSRHDSLVLPALVPIYY